MSFNSIIFLIFLPLVVILYWLLPHKLRWILLLIASYFFYAYHNVWLIFLIISTTLVSYLCSLCIGKTKKKWLKTLLLVISLVLILGALFVFKYLDFVIKTFTSLANYFGGNQTYTALNIILPVGISFYTFQTLSYVIDVYKDKCAPEKHLGYYALFVSFFPQLVAGPIERPSNLIPQLKIEKKVDSGCFSYGFQYLISGFIKKIVIADFLGIFVTNVYGNVMSSSGAALLMGTIFFSFQILGDFAGYSDIALGAAHLLGIQLTKNFDHPYQATSVSDFFRRWHITLNNWLRDYIYIPLGGSRNGLFRHIFNIMIVFLVSGFWHGASWNFVFWGILSGLLVSLEVLLANPISKLDAKIKINPKIKKAILIGVTFIVISATWIFFRAESISDAFNIYQRIFTAFVSGTGFEPFTNWLYIVRVILTLFMVIAVSYIPRLNFSKDEKGELDISSLFKTSTIYIVLLFVIAFCWVSQLVNYGESGFIYFQF